MLIGVFDSGIGGEAIAAQLRRLIPSSDVRSVNDSKNMPYGNKTNDEIIRLADAAIQPLLDLNCDAIIIACNTATTVAISKLRQTYPAVRIIGIEPMVKPAARMTKSGVIAVCATPSTLRSNRYLELKKTYAANIHVIEPDCSTWAKLIEGGEINNIDVRSLVESLVKQNVDVIVLGCTHYHWLKEQFVSAAGPDIKVLEPSDAIANRITELLT